MGRYYDMNTAKTDIRALLCLAVSEIAILVNMESHSRCFLQTLETLIIPRFFAKKCAIQKDAVCTISETERRITDPVVRCAMACWKVFDQQVD